MATDARTGRHGGASPSSDRWAQMMNPESNPGRLKVYTTTWCGDCTMAKTMLDRVGVEYDEINIDDDPAAAATVLAINGGYRSVPTILLPDGRVLVEPSRQTLLSALGLAESF